HVYRPRIRTAGDSRSVLHRQLRQEMDQMATPVQLARRFNRFVRTRSGVGVVRKLAMLWGLLAVGAGIIIPLFAQPHIQSDTFHGTFTLINPAVWGLTFLTVGAFVLVTLVSAKVELTSYLLFLLSV